MKAARQVLARIATKIVPSAKAPVSTAAKVVTNQLDTEQLRQIVGGALPKGNW